MKNFALNRFWSKQAGWRGAAVVLLTFCAALLPSGSANANIFNLGPSVLLGQSATITVSGPQTFSALENSGTGPVFFTITEAPQSATTITSVIVMQGTSSDPDDLMNFAYVGASATNLMTSNSSGNLAVPVPPPTSNFPIFFTPVDNSGVNDQDSGTTLFTITLNYTDAFCTDPTLPCGATPPQQSVYRGSGSIIFDIAGTTNDPPLPPPPGGGGKTPAIPEPSYLALLATGLVAMALVKRKRVADGIRQVTRNIALTS
jgi:hypothetical protein